MARVYSVSFENVAIAADQDFIYVAPADDKAVRLLGFFLSNVGGTADAGDEDVVLVQADAGVLLQDRQDHRDPRAVQPADRGRRLLLVRPSRADPARRRWRER